MDDKTTLVLATANQGKVAELIGLLGDRFEVLPRPADLAETVEDGRTLLDNATKKAVEVFVNTGLLAMADDTGLFVPSLGGDPGVRSARYAGRDHDDQANREKLLAALAAAGHEDADERRAYFETVIAIVGASTVEQTSNGGAVGSSDDVATLIPLVGRGRVTGVIATAERGESGFGYDSIFVPDDGDGHTFAEMDLAEKQAISHRSRALAEARRLLGAS